MSNESIKSALVLEVAEAGAAVTIAKRAFSDAEVRLAEANARLEAALAAYSTNLRSAHALPATCSTSLSMSETKATNSNQSIRERVLDLFRKSEGTALTLDQIHNLLHENKNTLRAIVGRLTKDPSNGIARVRSGVFKWIGPIATSNVADGPSKPGRKPSALTIKIDKALNQSIKNPDDWTEERIMIALAADMLDETIAPKAIKDRLYRRSRGKSPDFEPWLKGDVRFYRFTNAFRERGNTV